MIRLLLNDTAYPENYLSWQDVKDDISRSEKYHGVMISQTLDIEIICDAYDYVDGLDIASDVAAECTVKRQSGGDHEGWETDFEGYLDFTTLKRSNQGATKKITISAISSNFANKLLEREKVVIPYDRLETLDGDTITPFANEYESVDIEGVPTVGDNVPTVFDEAFYQGGGDGDYVFSILGLTTSSGNTSFQQVAALNNVSTITITDAYYLAPANTDITFNYVINYDFSSQRLVEPLFWFFELSVLKVKWDASGTAVSQTTLKKETKTAKTLSGQFTGEHSLSLEENEGIVFYNTQQGSGGVDQPKTYVSILENSTITTRYSELEPPTPCNFVPPFEMGTRLIEAITGQANGLDSPILGRTDSPTVYSEDGDASLYFHTNGKLIRQFPTGYITTDEEKKSQLKSSFLEWYESLDKLRCLGAGVKYEGGQYKLYIDDRKEFYKNEVVVSLIDSNGASMLEADTFEIEKDNDLYYNQISVGSDYTIPEEISGLEEYNKPQKYSTPVVKENELDLESKTITAAYPFEFTRRIPYNEAEPEDYKYDNNNFIFKTYRDGGFVQHSDQDYDVINGLENIFLYINLDLNPARVLRKNYGWWVNACLRGYQSGVLKYNASEIVTDLATRKNDESEIITANDDILISELESPKMTGELVKFQAPVSSATFKTLQADPYGLIEYINPLNNTSEYMFLKEASTSLVDKKTNWEGWRTTGFNEDGNFLLLQDGNNLLLETGGRIKLED